MERSLPVVPATVSAQNCVWADAGVLNFRLCNRGYACESCPLDAAIRSDPRLVLADATAGRYSARARWSFPSDRLYGEGHVWVQIVRAGRLRTGIDAFAARLLPTPERVCRAHRGDRVARGGTLCTLTLEGGELALRSPVSGVVSDWNAQLATSPAALTAEPYAAGWIAEIENGVAGELDALLRADAARQQARLDARRFGRLACFGLLALESPHDSWIDPGLLDATRRAVGGGPYISMVRDVLT